LASLVADTSSNLTSIKKITANEGSPQKRGEREPTDRRYFIGGSDARIIMGDDESALVRLWREKRGEVEPEDLSGNLVVQLGVVTEGLRSCPY